MFSFAVHSGGVNRVDFRRRQSATVLREFVHVAEKFVRGDIITASSDSRRSRENESFVVSNRIGHAVQIKCQSAAGFGDGDVMPIRVGNSQSVRSGFRNSDARNRELVRRLVNQKAVAA